MRFIDEARIRVSSGHGGPGCVSFRREAFVPRGGPNGGSGGKGGDVVFVASEKLSTLQDIRYRGVYHAKNGQPGSGANKTGHSGASVFLKVPCGTLIRDAETKEVLVDLVEDQQTWVALVGGRGGKGNAHFASATHQAPRFSQPGEPGENRELLLELKLLADAALVGFPNAGKSTLIRRISHARPKVANYPFTTRKAHLGVVSQEIPLVIADIPGLLEGAHRGRGLGHRFLKHLERTKVFLHLVDGKSLWETWETPERKENLDQIAQAYQTLRKEMELFQPELLKKTEFLVMTKLDLLDHPEKKEEIQSEIRKVFDLLRSAPWHPQEPWMISGLHGHGVETLMEALGKHLAEDTPPTPKLLPDHPSLRRA